MKIVTYNVNGIRSAFSKGAEAWLAALDPDVICLQEVKAMQDQIKTQQLEDLGYCAHWFSAQKKGYSGVATFSKTPPDLVIKGIDIEAYDNEGRIIRTDFGNVTLFNCYFPSGTMGDLRQDFKMIFLEQFFDSITGFTDLKPHIVIAGDYNIAHREIDIHNPKGNKNTSGFLPEERAWMTKWFSSGFLDAFRIIKPDEVAYSWWSYRANAKSNNKGWRINYISISESLSPFLKDAVYFPEISFSDHCPMMIDIRLD